MPRTAWKHFEEDIGRARALLSHARTLPRSRAAKAKLRDDILRSSWMYAVGAMDAYFCDAYADLIAKTLRAKSLQSSISLTSKIAQMTFPVGVIFAPAQMRENWKWRAAARGLIEKDSMLSLEKVRQIFNPFLRSGHKLFEAAVIDEFVDDYAAPQRFVGVSRSAYGRLSGSGLKEAQEVARKKLLNRFDSIFQRRHDCIHNCDRPKLALLRLSDTQVKYVVDDTKLLVEFFSNCGWRCLVGKARNRWSMQDIDCTDMLHCIAVGTAVARTTNGAAGWELVDQQPVPTPRRVRLSAMWLSNG